MIEYGCRRSKGYSILSDALTMVKDIEEFILEESQDSKYYAALAEKTSNPRAKKILREFSIDEKSHAESLMNMYYILTDLSYVVPECEEPEIPDYEEALKQRLLKETEDYEKYEMQHIRASSPHLKGLFLKIRLKEAQHAMRIPLLLLEKD